MAIKTSESVSEKFRSWLTRNRLTLEQFSRETDIHFSTAMKWFSGDNGPSDLAKSQIRRVFPGCPLSK